MRPAKAPSVGGKPKEFKRDQEKAPIHCNRPYDYAKTLPLSLSHHVFGQFIDDCDSVKATPADKTFLNEFVVAMSNIYDSEKDRQTKILKLFCDAGIDLQSHKITGTDYTTDGSLFVGGRLLFVLAELKNEIGSTGSEPYLQAALYFLEAARNEVSNYLTSGLPCMILLIYGMFAWIVFTVLFLMQRAHRTSH